MGARSAAASVARHVGGVAAEATLVAALVATVALAFSPVYAPAKFLAGTDSAAAKGNNSIWVDTSTLSASSALSFGQQMRFGYTTTAATSVQLQCYQPVGSSSLVFSASRLVTGTSGYTDLFSLGPSLAWTGGSATCNGLLGHRSHSGKYMVDAKVTFAVGP